MHFVLLLAALLTPLEEDWEDLVKRYKKELKPAREVAERLETIKNVAYFDHEEACALLLDALEDTVKHVVELEEKREENDGKIRKMLEQQILDAKKSDGMINVAGVELYQEAQRRLGDEITAEENVIRGFRDALGGFQNRDCWKQILKYKPPRRLDRLELLVIDVMGSLDDPEISELLIEKLSEKSLELRIAAAEALGRHDPANVPPASYGALLEAKEWPARAIAIEALSRIGGRNALEMLIRQTLKEEGHQLTDLCDRLEKMTGLKLGRSARGWIEWWSKAKDSFEPERIQLNQPLRVERDGGARYWGIEVDSLRVVFVLDISETMAASLEDSNDRFPPPGKSRLDLARREIKSAIQALSSDAVFNIIAFNDLVIPWQENGQPATPAVKKKAFEWLDQLVPVSATNIFDALEMAFEFSRGGSGDKYYDKVADTVLMVSDGGPTAGRTTDTEEILEQVAEWSRFKKITIHTIGFGPDIDRVFLEKLARQTGGEWRFKP
jgi:adenosyl cobinamide kinase/adenosyl cobinamide phosphate guanylyltransferase